MTRTIIKQIIRNSKKHLALTSTTPELDAEILLAFAMSCNRYELFLKQDSDLTDAMIEKYETYLNSRLNHMPVAYITGVQEFYSLEFMVNENVLIPRPDSETLIDCAKKYINQSGAILDLGTGSGALGLTLLKELPFSTATLVDVSTNALEVAMRNAISLCVSDRATFIKSNWFERLDLAVKYDLIISNPPYIAEYEKLQPQVYNYEPHMALFSNDNGNADYKRIVESACNYLKDDGYLIFEIGKDKENEISEILHDYEIVEIAKDLNGIARSIVAKKRLH